MREGRIGVAAAMHDGHLAVLIEALETRQAGIKPEMAVDLAHLVFRNGNARSQAIIGVIRVRHDGIKAIITARKLKHYKDTVRGIARCGQGRAPKRPAEQAEAGTGKAGAEQGPPIDTDTWVSLLHHPAPTLTRADILVDS